MKTSSILLAALMLQACAFTANVDPALLSIDSAGLPSPDIATVIPGMGPCTDDPDRTLHLSASEPVTVLVHGCFGSTGQFRALAQVMAFHGQQTACFTYDDRAALDIPASDLAASVDKLSRLLKTSSADPVTLVGHSQGALIARRALTTRQPHAESSSTLRLLTISGPFSGIAAANACGSPTVRALTLGLIAPMCRLGTGDKWADITYNSEFIRNPGTLSGRVSRHLKIDTDETGTCRRKVDEACVESDLIFTLDEQRNPAVDRDPAAEVVEVKAGHVEIVGDTRVAPMKLIALLQDKGIIRQTEQHRTGAFRRLLEDVYGDRLLDDRPAGAIDGALGGP